MFSELNTTNYSVHWLFLFYFLPVIIVSTTPNLSKKTCCTTPATPWLLVTFSVSWLPQENPNLKTTLHILRKYDCIYQGKICIKSSTKSTFNSTLSKNKYLTSSYKATVVSTIKSLTRSQLSLTKITNNSKQSRMGNKVQVERLPRRKLGSIGRPKTPWMTKKSKNLDKAAKMGSELLRTGLEEENRRIKSIGL